MWLYYIISADSGERMEGFDDYYLRIRLLLLQSHICWFFVFCFMFSHNNNCSELSCSLSGFL